jgi:hypothetical protein
MKLPNGFSAPGGLSRLHGPSGVGRPFRRSSTILRFPAFTCAAELFSGHRIRLRINEHLL